jgi:U3 small nucleolar RNA-associated protein 10
LAKAVVLKPSSNNTIRHLQTSIVAMIPGIPRPMNVPLDWLASSSVRLIFPEDDGAYTYMELMRTVYKLVTSTTSPLSTNLFETLFVNLQDDSLAFLAGIWTNTTDNEIRRIALSHAVAFLEAHKSKKTSIDFQTVLPSLLVALRSIDAEGKEIVLACISQLALLTEKRFSAVYGIDTIYGSGSGGEISRRVDKSCTNYFRFTANLQFLDKDDYKKYLMALLEHKEYLVSDSNYIAEFHQHHLGRNKSDKKKESEYVC